MSRQGLPFVDFSQPVKREKDYEIYTYWGIVKNQNFVLTQNYLASIIFLHLIIGQINGGILWRLKYVLNVG